MEKSHNTFSRKNLPRQLWTGLGLIGLLLGLALPAVASPQTAQPLDVFYCALVTEIPNVECQALLALYESTDGPNWKVPYAPWLSNNLPCSWYGVYCESGKVIGIDLASYCLKSCDNSVGLTGMLPPQIGNLTQLETLNLDNNQLIGEIPSEIGNLTNLVQLGLSFNVLSGDFPGEIGALTKLVELSLSNNSLSGSIPAEIGDLTELRFLNLGYNQLTGSIPPEIGNLTKLRTLYLRDNQLSGSIPPEIGSLLILSDFDLSNNQLTSLPHEIGNLTILVSLYLPNNQISSLPAEIGNLANLTYLNLSNNQISSLPPEIGGLSKLQMLFLENNQLTSLPTGFGNLSEMWSLNLDNNQLAGLPPGFGNLTNLTWLLLDQNQLTSLPPEIGHLSQLAGIWLSDNKLTTLPPEFGNLNELWGIYLTNNPLSSLPPEFGKLSHLRILELSNNQLTSLPPEFGRLSNLWSLYLDNNQLTSLPHEFSRLKLHADMETGEYTLDLSYNRLSISDPVLLAYLNTVDPDWADTQTVPPTDLQLHNAPQLSLELAWAPIRYSNGPGFYELSQADDPTGPYMVAGTTPDKTSAEITAFRSPTQPAYYFRMRTYSAAHDAQLQDLWSAYSPPFAILYTPVNATTTATLAYTDAHNQTIQVEVPAGAVSRPGTLYLSTSIANQLLPQSALTGQAFTLGLYQDGAYSDDLRLPVPFTLTLTYLVNSLVAEHLRLVYWDPSAGAWREAAQTCSPPQIDELRPVEQQMVVPVCRLGTYALVSAQPIRYLPAIRHSR